MPAITPATDHLRRRPMHFHSGFNGQSGYENPYIGTLSHTGGLPRRYIASY